MATDLTELARRAVACENWQWLRGMTDTTGRLFVAHADCGEAMWLWVADDGCEALPIEGRLPDLEHPVTVQSLLLLVREAHGPETYSHPLRDEENPTRWEVGRALRTFDDDLLLAEGDTEAEALVAALELPR